MSRHAKRAVGGRGRRIAASTVLATTGLFSSYLALVRPQPTYATPTGGAAQGQGSGLLMNRALLQSRAGAVPSCGVLTPVTNATDLAAAITAANATALVDETICIDGTITLMSALPTITSTLTLVGDDAATDKLVVDAAYEATVGSIVTGNLAATGTVTIANLGFTGGRAGVVRNLQRYGGALDIRSTAPYKATLVVHNSTFTDNRVGARGRGGAISIAGDGYFKNSTFTSNIAGTRSSSSSGGAVYVKDGDLTVATSTFTSNTSSSRGGGIFASTLGTVTVTDSTFTSNYTNGQGGALNMYQAGTLSISGSTFTSNATDYRGGGVGGAINHSGGVFTVASSTFADNTGYSGGAIYTWGNGTVTVTGSSFTGNAAEYRGGAIYAGASVPRSQVVNLTVTNSFMGSNTAKNRGGAIEFPSPGTLALTFSTIYDNSVSPGTPSSVVADKGGTLTATGSVVGSSTSTAMIVLTGGATATGISSVSTDAVPVFTGVGSSTVAAGSLQLQAVTGTAAGQPGRSPALGSVLVTGAPTTDLGTGVTVDQLGTTRSGIWTIGSRQVTPPPPTPPAPDDGGATATPSASPTPTPTSTPTAAPLDLIDNSRNPNVPTRGLPPGGSLLLVGGQPAPVTVAPNASNQATGLSVRGDGWTATLVGRGDSTDPLGLSPKNALILQSQQVAGPRSGLRARSAPVTPVAQATGTGFRPDSAVKFYLLPSTYVGELRTDSAGSFNGTLPVPAGLVPGDYTMQMNGLAPSGEVRSLSLGVVVQSTVARTRTAKADATLLFPRDSAELTAAGKARLRALVKRTGTEAVRVVSVGFVQRSGSSSNDQTLSTARARAVGAYLRELGLRGTYVVRGDGVGGPSSADRKVEVTITYPVVR